MSLNKYYKEKEYAEELLKKRNLDIGAKSDLKILAKYYKSEGKKYKEIEELLYSFVNSKCKKWFREALHYKIIDSAISHIKKKENQLVQIESVSITDNELAYIESLDYTYIEKKILFTMLTIAKLKQAKQEYKGFEVNHEINYFSGGVFSYKTMMEVMCEKLTRTFKEKEIHKIIKKFNDDGLTRTANNTSLELLFVKNIEHSENEVLIIHDFDTVGLYYDSVYYPEKVKVCEECNVKLVKITNYKNKYCNECRVKVEKIKTNDRVKKFKSKINA